MGEPLRVKTEAKYKNLYGDLKNLAIGDFHELFTICAFIGHKFGKPAALNGPNKDRDRFWSDTFSQREWACFRAICLKDGRISFSDILDERKILTSIEEYANGGMIILLDEFLQEYVSEKEGDYFLEDSTIEELPKRFLSYIHDLIGTTGQSE
jgi:hypothetical protein